MLIFWVTCIHMNLLHPKVNIHLNKGSLQAAQGCLGCLALRTESCLRVKICQCCVVLRSQGRVAGWGRWSSGDVGRVPLASLSPGHCCTSPRTAAGGWSWKQAQGETIGSIFVAYHATGELAQSQHPRATRKDGARGTFSVVVVTLPPPGRHLLLCG